MSTPAPSARSRASSARLPLALTAYAIKCGTDSSARSIERYASSNEVRLYTNAGVFASSAILESATPSA
jgi:hypothetical protein